MIVMYISKHMFKMLIQIRMDFKMIIYIYFKKRIHLDCAGGRAINQGL